MAQTALVTGGAGFIGSRLCEKLVEEGLEVKVFDNLSTGYMHNLVKVKKDIEFEKGDILDYNKTLKAIKSSDFVFHLAALSYVQESIKEPEKYMKTNIEGTFNVLQGCREANVKKYFFPSTCIVYGSPDFSPVPENSQLRPGSPYGITKVAGEFYAKYFFSQFGLETTCLRIFNTFGPRMQNRVISIFAKQIMEGKPITLNGTGEQERDFIFVDDIAEGFLAAMKAGTKSAGKIYNIGTGKSITLNQMLRKMQGQIGKKARIEYKPDVRNEIYKLIADTGLAEEELGFTAKTGFEEGLKKTIESMKGKK